MRVKGAVVVDAEGVNVSSEGRRQSLLGVPSLWSVREMLEVFINHRPNLFSHNCADTD